MSKRKKRLEKIRRSPKNVSLDELRKVLEDCGFVLDRVTGSHHIFIVEMEQKTLSFSLPFKRPPLKEIYVKDLLSIIDKYNLAKEIEQEKEETDDE